MTANDYVLERVETTKTDDGRMYLIINIAREFGLHAKQIERREFVFEQGSAFLAHLQDQIFQLLHDEGVL